MGTERRSRREPDYEGRESRKLYQQATGEQVRQQMAEPERRRPVQGSDAMPRHQVDCGAVFWSWALRRI